MLFINLTQFILPSYTQTHNIQDGSSRTEEKHKVRSYNDVIEKPTKLWKNTNSKY